jgi:hypothetical protein
MIGFGWLTLRQAEEALASGRLDEAHEFLRRPEAVGHKGASAMLRKLANDYLARGAERLKHEQLDAAWSDLVLAERLGAEGGAAAKLRQALTKQGVAEARKLLDAGEPGRAAQALAQLARTAAGQAEVQLLEEVAAGWSEARELAARGDMGLALERLERVARLLPTPPAALERFKKEVQIRRPTLAVLVVQLHEAWAQERWADVLRLAEQVLALAPQHAEARKARGRAWKAIEPAGSNSAMAPPEEDGRRRFLLWIDGVGGFLVCLARRVTLGQAAPDGTADVPLLADVSRAHAALTRDTEGYLLEALRPVKVNDKSTERALLQPGDRLTVGGGCRLQFRQPVPVSASARLDLISGHRLPLALDGVLLMADTLVLGPGMHAHVTVPELPHNVVLFRSREAIGIRYPGSLTVDGQKCKERATLGETSKVRADDLTFALEPFGHRAGKL